MDKWTLHSEHPISVSTFSTDVLSSKAIFHTIRMRYMILLNVRTGPVNLSLSMVCDHIVCWKEASPKTHRTAIGRRH